VHQPGSNSGGAKPRKRGASVLDESNRGKKRIEVTSEEGREEIFDEDGFMIVQDVPFDELIWVEVTKLDGKKDLYSTLAIKEDLAKKLGLEFPIRREEGSMRAARVQSEAPAGKEAVVAAPPDADKPKKQRKKGDPLILPLPQKAFCKGELDPTEISNAKRGPIPWNGRPSIGEGAIGRAVRVYRKEENDWFTATVAAYDSTRAERRYLLFYDECELEWIALAGAGPIERIEFHKNLPELQMITELNARVHYLQKVLGPATNNTDEASSCVICGKDATRECSNAVRWEVMPWHIKQLCTSGERICTTCCKDDSWDCSACRALAAAPPPSMPIFPWFLWKLPDEPVLPLPSETNANATTEVIAKAPRRRDPVTEVVFHRPSFLRGMKEWTERANLAGSPLPHYHEDYFAYHFNPHAPVSANKP
jgi:hypothetical protein